MGKIPTNSLGKSSELELHCFCLFDACSMPKDIYSAGVQAYHIFGEKEPTISLLCANSIWH